MLQLSLSILTEYNNGDEHVHEWKVGDVEETGVEVVGDSQGKNQDSEGNHSDEEWLGVNAHNAKNNHRGKGHILQIG